MIPAGTVEGMLAGFSALGLDAQQLSVTAGLPSPLPAPDVMLPRSLLEALLSAAIAARPNPELPSEAGLAVPFGAFGVTDYLAGSAENTEGGLLALASHFRAITPGIALELEKRGSLAYFHARSLRKDALAWLGEEFTLAVTLGRCRSLAGHSGFSVSAVTLTRPPVVNSRHAELLGAPVSFASAPRAAQERALGRDRTARVARARSAPERRASVSGSYTSLLALSRAGSARAC